MGLEKYFIYMKLIKKYWPILIVLFAGVLASRTLLFESGYFNMHDDLQMMRQLEMEKCFKDLQIPCRWVPDMGYGYGFPLFNFYPPLPYLLGEVFRVFQFSFVDTAKITFALGIILSGLAMYFLSKEFFGKEGGVISSIFYIWAPYHSVDVYVRGAMNESWALIWFPLILLFGYKLITEDKKTLRNNILLLAFSWVGLLLSHNLMVMIFAPVFGVWCLIWILKSKNFVFSFINLLKSGLLALGLSSFFTIPAIFEQKLVHVDTLTQGYYEYIAHFATINQLLFSRFWGYGASIWGDNDGMPFPAGHIHWVLSLALILLTILYLRKKGFKKAENWVYVVVFMFLVGWFAVFMAHSRSTFIWQLIKPLAFVQFPWRFLTIVVFSFSFIAGAITLFAKNKFIQIALILLVIVWNWQFFLPQHGKMGPLTDSQKFSGAAWDLQRTAGIFDYLPESAKENPKDGANILAEVYSGKAVLTNMQQGTNWARFDINSEKSGSTVRINLFDFPKWNMTLDGKQISHYVPDTEKYGRIYIDVPQGSHRINMKLENTPIRNVSNMISLLSWIFLAAYLIKLKSE